MTTMPNPIFSDNTPPRWVLILPIVFWFLLAGTMVLITSFQAPGERHLGQSFIAWLGGVVSTLAVVAVFLLTRKKKI